MNIDMNKFEKLELSIKTNSSCDLDWMNVLIIPINHSAVEAAFLNVINMKYIKSWCTS